MLLLVKVHLGLFIEKGTEAVKRNDLVIMIDVLRCSSTIITALYNGIIEITPVESLEEAIELRKNQSDLILAGERNGLKPNGFDLGNSPNEFISGSPEGKKAVITTSNGTKALEKVKNCKWVLVGTFLNSESVVNAAFKLAKEEKSGITILLASSSEDIYLEDFICGGLLSKKLLSMGANLDDSAYASMLAWNNAKENLNEIIKKSHHGEYLKGIGFENDIDFCLKIDLYPIVPWSNNGKIGLLPKERFIS